MKKQKIQNKICVICQREIKKKDDYFKVELFLKGKLKGTDWAHRVCWLDRLNSNNKSIEIVNQAGRLLNNMQKSAIDKGLIEPEVITI